MKSVEGILSLFDAPPLYQGPTPIQCGRKEKTMFLLLLFVVVVVGFGALLVVGAGGVRALFENVRLLGFIGVSSITVLGLVDTLVDQVVDLDEDEVEGVHLSPVALRMILNQVRVNGMLTRYEQGFLHHVEEEEYALDWEGLGWTDHEMPALDLPDDEEAVIPPRGMGRHARFVDPYMHECSWGNSREKDKPNWGKRGKARRVRPPHRDYGA